MSIDCRTLPRLVALGAPFCISAALAGCGVKNYQPPPAAEPAVARSSLEKALDAWRLQTAPDDLLKAEPAVTVADPDWRSGQRLAEYRLQSGEQALGSSIYWPVQLRIVQANGHEQWLDVTYIISTSPIIHISRQD